MEYRVVGIEGITGRDGACPPAADAAADALDVRAATSQASEEAVNDGDDDDVCGPSFFEEDAQCRELLRRLADLLPSTRLPDGLSLPPGPAGTAAAASQLLPSVGQDPAGAAGVVKQLEKIIDRYQECPHLLYPHLESLVAPLVALLLRYLPPAQEVWAYEAAVRQRKEGQLQQQQHQQGGDSSSPTAVEEMAVAQPSTLGRNYDLFDMDAPRTAVHLVCQAIYSIVKTAGEQACTSHFPNDVRYYEDIFYALRLWKNTEDSEGAIADAEGRSWASVRQREWQVRYCLLLWLCNLVLVPFSLSTIDSSTATTPPATVETAVAREGRIEHGATLSDAVLATAVALLADSTKCRDGAALLVARLLTRPDSQRHREAFFAYAQALVAAAVRGEALTDYGELNFLTRALVLDAAAHPTQYAQQQSFQATFLVPGVLAAMAEALKRGQRQELLPYASALIPGVASLLRRRACDALLCKTAVKVTQRLVLTMLRKTSAAWKYARHDVTSLDANLGALAADASIRTAASTTAMGSLATCTNEGTDDGDVLEGDQDALEEGIGLLLETLTHKDTIVRWSSAKGLGLVCDRLPGDVASEVVEAVFQCLEDQINDGAWHGGLLALAELCRRSIIDAPTLSRVVTKIATGLAFDLSRGTYSVGAHVRDAACYACWSIARAYDAADLVTHVHTLSGALVVTALFDREVSVRRAAAAAFQECVGRLGSFPDGIELVTRMDFFSLASRQRAFLHVAPAIATHDAYRGAMLEELVSRKLIHWDRAVRECAAGALGKVAATAFDKEGHAARRTLDAMVEELQRRVLDQAVATRHGAVLGLAELVRGGLPVGYWTEAQRRNLADVVVRVDQARLFRSRGGEHIRAACCSLLSACAEVALPVPEFVQVTRLGGATAKARTRGKWQEFLETTWGNILEWLQLVAADAFAKVSLAYDTAYQPSFHGKMITKMLDSAASAATAAPGSKVTPLERRGVLAAMGGLPTALLVATQSRVEMERFTTAAPTAAEDGQPFFVAVLETLCAAAVEPKETIATSAPTTAAAATGTAAETMSDAEGRRNAVRSVASVISAVPPSHSSLTPTLYQHVLVNCLLAALQDYATDKRGDVGSFVRLTALQALPAVLRVGLARPELLALDRSDDATVETPTPSLPVRVLQGAVKAALEKLDRVRNAAVSALTDLLSLRSFADENKNVCGGAPLLLSTLSMPDEVTETRYLQSRMRELCAGDAATDTSAPARVIGSLACPLLLHAPHHYARPAMEGLVLAAGDLSIHIQQPGMQAIFAAFRGGGDGKVEQTDAASEDYEKATAERLSALLVGIGQSHPHTDRVLTPLSRVLDRLLNASLLAPSVHGACVQLLRSELKHFATTITVLLPLTSLLATLCRSSDLVARQEAWALALTMVASRYPKVRARMAADFYTALVVLTAGTDAVRHHADGKNGAAPSSWLEGCEAAMALLLQVQWDSPDVVKVRAARDQLYGMLVVAPPGKGADAGVGVMRSSGSGRQTRAKVASSYAALVHEAGY